MTSVKVMGIESYVFCKVKLKAAFGAIRGSRFLDLAFPRRLTSAPETPCSELVPTHLLLTCACLLHQVCKNRNMASEVSQVLPGARPVFLKRAGVGSKLAMNRTLKQRDQLLSVSSSVLSSNCLLR